MPGAGVHGRERAQRGQPLASALVATLLAAAAALYYLMNRNGGGLGRFSPVPAGLCARWGHEASPAACWVHAWVCVTARLPPLGQSTPPRLPDSFPWNPPAPP